MTDRTERATDSPRRPLVCCVDDDAGVLAALQRLLRGEPYDVLTLDDPERALAEIRSREVSVLITDHRMPQMSGAELLRQVAECSPETRQMVLTAYPDRPLIVAGRQLGIHWLLTKPWDDEELKDIIRALLQEREQAAPPGDRARRTVRALPKLRRRHVIVCVDDDPRVLGALRRILRADAFDLRTTTAPAEALEWMERVQASLFIVDERLPQTTGMKLVEEAHRRSPKTIPLMLTGHPDTAIVLARMRGGIRRLLTKPWDDSELRNLIYELLHELELEERSSRAP